MRSKLILVATTFSLLIGDVATAQSLPRLSLHSALLAASQDDADDAASERDGADAAERPAASGSGATGFVRPQGFYTSSDLGGFIRFGGYADGEECGFRCKPRTTSNLQPYIGLAVGYDLLDFLAVQVSFGTGFVANAAPVANTPDSPRDYGITFVNLALIGSYYFTGIDFLDRFGVVLKLFGGGSFVSPAPLPDSSPFGGNVGGGLGFRWATLLTDVTVGVDVNGYAVFVQDGLIPGMSFAPVLQYTF